MTLSENLITVLVLVLLAIIGYCKYTKRTFGEFLMEIKDATSSRAEEVIESKGGIE